MKRVARLCIAVALCLTAAAQAVAADALVTADWVAQNATKPGVVVLDVRPNAAYLVEHIRGAVPASYRLPQWRTPAGGPPTALPSEAAFAAFAARLGISQTDHVVIVGEGNTFVETAQATHAYWIFKVMGHLKVSLLDGGMRAYGGRMLPKEKTIRTPSPGQYTKATPVPGLVATADDVRQSIGRILIIDARPAGQFLGVTKTPMVRRAGTIPSALHLPANWMLQDTGNLFRGGDVRKRIFDFAKVPADRETIVVSDRGMLSSLLWFVLQELNGNTRVRNYNGGLVDWTQNDDNPVARRAAID